MIGSLEVAHELIFTIPSIIQICSISSVNSIRLRFNLGKPRMGVRKQVFYLCAPILCTGKWWRITMLHRNRKWYRERHMNNSKQWILVPFPV